MQPYSQKHICVALSGGTDSVCLLHYLHSHAAQYAIALSAVTCEHGIRGEASLRDLAFVERLCKDWDIPLHVYRENVPALAKKQKIGLEEAGRLFRYACFRAVLENSEADLIATAHHRDDLVETILFRLIRGTSLGGLNVFPEQNGIIRPLADISRAQIMQYVRENSLPFVTDESNSDESYTRNFLRHTVLPALEQAVNGAGAHLAAFAQRAVQDDEFLQKSAQDAVQCVSGVYEIPVGLPLPLFTRACVYALKQQGVSKDYTEANLKEISALKTLQSGKRVCLPKGMTAIREHDNVVICRPDAQTPFELPFKAGKYTLNGLTLVISEDAEGAPQNALKVDLDAFPEHCVIRTRREGDVFTPFGGNTKTLKKFLTDKKIPARRGRLLPLIASGNVILAVCGVEISDQVKIAQNTARIGYLYPAPCSQNDKREK